MTNNKQQTAMDRKIGNSDKSLVIYTHDDVIKMMNTFHTSILNRDLCMAKLTPIQLPSDDEINEMGIDVIIYNDTKRGWFVEGLKFMRDKIQEQ
jgi:hypothetical protein